jgi:hypothetical protein
VIRTSPSYSVLAVSTMAPFELTTSRFLSRSTSSVFPMTAPLSNAKKLMSSLKR